jgi:hypothetical protein
MIKLRSKSKSFDKFRIYLSRHFLHTSKTPITAITTIKNTSNECDNPPQITDDI